MRSLLAPSIITGSILSFVACDKTSNVSVADPIAQTTAVLPTTSDLTQDEIQSLIHMRQLEKLARDVFLFLYQKWPDSIFNTIASSEQRHMDAIKTLLDKYEIDDPITNDSIGFFEDPDLTELFANLVDQGNRSLLDALIVGATLEDLEIYNLDEALSDIVVNPDIIKVYTHLTNGSENHLRAFYVQILNNGGVYTPQYISEEIISGSNRQGRLEYGDTSD